MSDVAYSAWVTEVHALGGVATAWPFSTGPYGSSYAAVAARFPVATYTALVDNGTFNMGMDGVQTNVPGTWVYVLASAMTGNQAVDESISSSVNTATQAEQEQACAANGDCPVDWSALVKEIVIGLAVLVGASVLGKLG